MGMIRLSVSSIVTDRYYLEGKVMDFIKIRIHT